MLSPANPTAPPLVSSLIVGIVHVSVICPAALVSSVMPVGNAGAVVSAPDAVSTDASRYGRNVLAASLIFAEITTSSVVPHQFRVSVWDVPAPFQKWLTALPVMLFFVITFPAVVPVSRTPVSLPDMSFCSIRFESELLMEDTPLTVFDRIWQARITLPEQASSKVIPLFAFEFTRLSVSVLLFADVANHIP